MQFINFSIEKDNIAIKFQDEYLDLHNNYDFVSFGYEVGNRSFLINWKRSDGDWVSEKLPERLRFSFTNTIFLKVKEIETDQFSQDDKCLDTIGFCSLDMRDDMESVLVKWDH